MGERESRGGGVGEVGLKKNSAGEKARSLRRGGSDEHRKTSEFRRCARGVGGQGCGGVSDPVGEGPPTPSEACAVEVMGFTVTSRKPYRWLPSRWP